jgi:hypothetical protein
MTSRIPPHRARTVDETKQQAIHLCGKCCRRVGRHVRLSFSSVDHIRRFRPIDHIIVCSLQVRLEEPHIHRPGWVPHDPSPGVCRHRKPGGARLHRRSGLLGKLAAGLPFFFSSAIVGSKVTLHHTASMDLEVGVWVGSKPHLSGFGCLTAHSDHMPTPQHQRHCRDHRGRTVRGLRGTTAPPRCSPPANGHRWCLTQRGSLPTYPTGL